MSARIGVVTFPGSLDDKDAARAVLRAGGTPVRLWHADTTIGAVDAVVLPGGFSYGDYLRAGAIARFSPLMRSIVAGAHRGLPVLGICNGFQILCESHLLPGVLMRNAGLHFVCRDQKIQVVGPPTAWTRSYQAGEILELPVKNGEGRYTAAADVLDDLENDNLIVFRYVDGNPSGAARDIAGITNPDRNVVGLMPHPEHAIDLLTGPSADGLGLFTSVLGALVEA
jgi:phosphoribosylformylglycinamidine synthase